MSASCSSTTRWASARKLRGALSTAPFGFPAGLPLWPFLNRPELGFCGI